MRTRTLLLLSIGLLAISTPGFGMSSFIRGDADTSEFVNINDPIITLQYLFLGNIDLSCHSAADFNDNGALGITDAIGSLKFMFLGDLPPAPPYPNCGPDETPDPLSCDSFGLCDDDDPIPPRDVLLLDGITVVFDGTIEHNEIIMQNGAWLESVLS